MFLLNKYTKWYYNIINNAKLQSRLKSADVYYEKHHIIPNCIQKNNDVVLLTAKEHYICHLLLTKMCDNIKNKMKMINALIRMSFGGNDHQTRYRSNSFSLVRKMAAERTRHIHTGKKLSEEHKQRLRQCRLGKTLNEDAKLNLKMMYKGKSYEERFGIERAIEIKEKRSKSKQGKNNPMFGVSPWNKGLNKTTDIRIKQYGIKQSHTKRRFSHVSTMGSN